MKLTGYQIREATRTLLDRRALLGNRIVDMIRNPVPQSAAIPECEDTDRQLLEMWYVQGSYNLAVETVIVGRRQPLARTVNEVKGLEERLKLVERAVNNASPHFEDAARRAALAFATGYAKGLRSRVAEVRAEIARANSTQVDLDVPEALFELFVTFPASEK